MTSKPPIATPSDPRKAFAERLREAAAARGLSGNALAAESGIRQSTISRAMRGESVFRMAAARAVAEALGVRVAWLLDGDGPPPEMASGATADQLMSALDAALQVAGIELDLAVYKAALRTLARTCLRDGRIDHETLSDVILLLQASPKAL